MKKVFCQVAERFVNPLFEVFDGGDFILSSYRDIELPLAQMQIFFEDFPGASDDAARRLQDALRVVGVEAEISVEDVPDEDWKFAYRRHFKTEEIGARLLVVPTWELEGIGETARRVVTLDPGMAFGTGKHETTRACLEYIEECSENRGWSFLDMGCGSGILSIAAAKLGYLPVTCFDVDQEAVDATIENLALNKVEAACFRYGLGAKVRRELPVADLVAANILGPLLIRFSGEISSAVGRRLIISGILNELYGDVLAAFVGHGLREVSRKSIGEWTTGLLEVGR